MRKQAFNIEPKTLLPWAATVAIGGLAWHREHRGRKAAEQRARIAEKMEEHLHNIATHDPLTGTLNKRGLDELLSKEKLPRALLHVDATNLKAVNDNLGHERGDEAIVGTADVLLASLRPDDVVARVGGDEFYVLLDTERRKIPEPLSSDELLSKVMPRVHDKTQELLDENPDLKAEGFDIAVGGTILREGMSFSDGIQEAEAAMYDMKSLQHVANGSHR